MTNEEMQKTMEFIVQQQAQASAKIDALSEAQTDERLNNVLNKTVERQISESRNGKP